MGRSVADIARLLGTQAGYDPQVPLSLKDDPAIFNEPLQRDFAARAWAGWGL